MTLESVPQEWVLFSVICTTFRNLVLSAVSWGDSVVILRLAQLAARATMDVLPVSAHEFWRSKMKAELKMPAEPTWKQYLGLDSIELEVEIGNGEKMTVTNMNEFKEAKKQQQEFNDKMKEDLFRKEKLTTSLPDDWDACELPRAQLLSLRCLPQSQTASMSCNFEEMRLIGWWIKPIGPRSTFLS